MRKAHYIIFPRNSTQVEMRLKVWARENQHYFTTFGFTNSQDDHPITHVIRDYCIRNLNDRIDENKRRVVIYI